MPQPDANMVMSTLRSLGRGYRQVAKTLLDNGMRGEKEDSQSCPVAHYLQRQYPGVQIGVDNTEITVGELTLTPPPAVATFVTKFDEDVFPALVEHQPHCPKIIRISEDEDGWGAWEVTCDCQAIYFEEYTQKAADRRYQRLLKALEQ